MTTGLSIFPASDASLAPYTDVGVTHPLHISFGHIRRSLSELTSESPMSQGPQIEGHCDNHGTDQYKIHEHELPSYVEDLESSKSNTIHELWLRKRA